MIIPSDYAQANYFFSGDALPYGAQVTLGIKVSSTSLTGQQVADLLMSAADDTWFQEMCASVSSTKVSVKYGPNATGPVYEAAGVGGLYVANVPLPPNTAFLVKKSTGLGGRKGRGRMYIPGVSSQWTDAKGFLNGTHAADMTGMWATFESTLAADDVFCYLLHGDATAPTLISSFACEATVATQRDRLRP